MDEDRSRRPTGIFGFRLLAEPRVQRAAIATILVVFAIVRATQVLTWSTQIQWGYDFSAYWLAGRHVVEGVPIYAPFQLGGPYSPQQQYLYLYPPALAVAIAPLAGLVTDYRVANWLWAAFGAILVASWVGIVAVRSRIASGRDTALLVGAAFVFAPVVGELVLGNVHLLIFALLSGAWLEADRGSRRGDVSAGILVGVATMIKVFPGLVILWFMLTGRRRAAAAALAAMAVIGLATVPFVGLGPWLDYPTVLLNLGSPVDTTDVLAPTVWLSTVLSPSAARIVVGVIGLSLVVWATRRRVDPVSYAITVAVSILIAPGLYQHYLAVLVLPMLMAIRFAPPVAWVAIAYVLMSGGEQAALGDAVWVVNRALPTLGAVLAVVGLARFGRRPVDAADKDATRTPHRRLRVMPSPETLTILLPAYNEAERIGPALDELFGYLRRRGLEARDGAPGSAGLPARIDVLVVDDGSVDETAALVAARPEAAEGADLAGASLRVMTVPHMGKGAAVRAGMLASDSDLIVFADADMATPPDQLPLLVAALADHDLAFGSRIQSDGSDMRASQPGSRRLLGKAFHMLASAWVAGPVKDTQCGFKGFTRAAAHDLFARQRITSIVFDVELVFLARRRGYRLAIVPIRWEDRRGSRMRARPALALRVAWDLFRIPLVHRRMRRADA